MKTYLILDVNNLAWRAFHSTGGLSYQELPTGVLYGVLRDVGTLTGQFQTERLVFCFDRGKGLREQVCPTYKITRRKRQMTDEEAETREQVSIQIRNLRTTYLPDMGYRNVFSQEGYEADDVMASVVLNSLRPKDRAILVTGDKDVYQLLSDRVSAYDPRGRIMTTYRSFVKDYGIRPKLWPYCKAIGGCQTDDVDGLEGVAEKTALKYLRRLLGPKDAKYRLIQDSVDVWRKNLELVKLPYPGCKTFKLEEDEFSPDGWDAVCGRLGITSLRPPGAACGVPGFGLGGGR